VSFQFFTQRAAGLIPKYHHTSSKITGVLQTKSHPSYIHSSSSTVTLTAIASDTFSVALRRIEPILCHY